VPEGSPPDPAPVTEALEASPDPNETETPSEARSPEEIEAIWKNRVSKKDAAHDAEVKALRENLAAAEKRATAKAAAEAADASEADQWKARAEAAEAQVQQERQDHIREVRSTKYPHAAEALDPDVIAAMDEGKLASLNSRLSGEEEEPSGGPIDPNAAPKRPPTPPTAPKEKSVAELEGDLRKFAPEFIADMANK
jgi:hypothetical protein